jgi:hypothetical protein
MTGKKNKLSQAIIDKTRETIKGAVIPDMQPVQGNKPGELGVPIPGMQPVSDGQPEDGDGQAGNSDQSSGTKK